MGSLRLKVWRAIGVCLVLAAVGATAALGQDASTGTSTGTDQAVVTDPGTTTGTTTVSPPPPPASPEPPPPEPPRIADGVTVSGVAVGGMTAEEAAAALTAFWRRPFVLSLGTRTWTPPMYRLGASTRIAAAVTQALAAAPSTSLTLSLAIDRDTLRGYVARRARELYRPAVNSTVRLRDLRPFITKARSGRRVLRLATRQLIVADLKVHERGPVAIQTTGIRPRITRSNFGPVVVIRRGSHRLYLYNGMTFRASFGVATGLPQYPTPLGRFHIVSKVRWPWWYPPDSAWAAGASPVPPGPNNPLGTRWMGLSVGGVGIHGTPSAWSIGYSASHGCIRMRIPEAEWLFERVRVGTPVFIVSA